MHASYFHKSWVRILWGATEEELADRLATSLFGHLAPRDKRRQ